MKNVHELRNALAECFEKTKEGKMDPKLLGELNNTAGKMIASARTQVEYAVVRKIAQAIPFLDEPAEPAVA